jgi:hypothetical protein
MATERNSLLAERIRKVILEEYSILIPGEGSLTGRFILIAVGIEFLGGCLDRQHMNATGRGEKRFNNAVRELFPKKYHHFTKPQSVPNLYIDFRCPVIHQFTAGKGVHLCSANHASEGGLKHLSYNSEGSLILVAEDFYTDLTHAAQALILRMNSLQGL